MSTTQAGPAGPVQELLADQRPSEIMAAASDAAACVLALPNHDDGDTARRTGVVLIAEAARHILRREAADVQHQGHRAPARTLYAEADGLQDTIAAVLSTLATPSAIPEALAAIATRVATLPTDRG